MGRREGLLGDEADLVERKVVDETRGVDIPLPHSQVRHLRQGGGLCKRHQNPHTGPGTRGLVVTVKKKSDNQG